ncbi:MAG: hypothetical protein CVT96_02110 [Bacteroidetes bacterium HGW-Bacteroidetes-13]|nr:MAG: hypothetical protein CVT96_02110 [Bacteroidetes bacterium HGW-Bacteroidetes-13]
MKISSLFKKFLLVLTLFITVWSCSKSNNDLTPTPVDPIDQAVQTLIDDVLIVDYLQTHFYNAADFQNPAPNFNFDIIFDTIAGENSTQTPLFNQVEKKSFVIDDVTFNYYILKINEGFGNRPHFIDSTLVNFRGSLLNNIVFDSSVNPIWFDLGTVVDGFRQAMLEFKSAESSSLNSDGTSTFTNFGVGAVFFPSGMGFANIPQPNVPANSPLVFRIKLFASLEADHDLDGIPSWMEDLNNNQNPSDDDTDGDRFPNYLDTNDDGDLILTFNEIIINPDGTITFPDCDGDGIPDYLDKDICPK